MIKSTPAPSQIGGLVDDLRVYCQILNDSIPTTLCVSEQGQPDCHGCNASSRQCEKCKRQPVAHQYEGLCKACHNSAAPTATEDYLDDLLKRVRRFVVDGPVAARSVQSERPVQVSLPAASSVSPIVVPENPVVQLAIAIDEEQQKRLVQIVARRFQISVEGLLGEDRSRYLVVPRHLLMHILKGSGLNYPEVARITRRANHTVVLHGYRQVEMMLQVDSTLQEKRRAILEELLQPQPERPALEAPDSQDGLSHLQRKLLRLEELRKNPFFTAWEDANAEKDPSAAVRGLEVFSCGREDGKAPLLYHAASQQDWYTSLLDGCGMWANYRGLNVLVVLNYRSVYPLPDAVLDDFELSRRIMLLTPKSNRSWGKKSRHCFIFEGDEGVQEFLIGLMRTEPEWLTW